MADLRAVVAALEAELGGVKRELAWMKRGCVIHVQGSKDLEQLHAETIETRDGGGFTAFKRGAGAILAREVALFLGYKWPKLLKEGEVREELEAHDRNRLDILEEFIDNITKPRLIVNIYPKVVTTADGSKERTEECFAVQLDFGARMLLIKQSLQDGLTAMLRHRCGEPVWEDGYIGQTIGLQTTQRPGVKSEAGAGGTAAAAAEGGADRPADEAETEGAGGAAEEAQGVGAGGTVTPPGADGAVPGGEDDLAGADDEMEGTRTEWLLITIPPLDLGLSRRAAKGGGKAKGVAAKGGKGRGKRPPAGSEPKAAPTPPPNVLAPLGPNKSRGKGSTGGKGPKGKGKGKDKGKGKGKGQAKGTTGRRPAAKGS